MKDLYDAPFFKKRFLQTLILKGWEDIYEGVRMIYVRVWVKKTKANHEEMKGCY